MYVNAFSLKSFVVPSLLVFVNHTQTPTLVPPSIDTVASNPHTRIIMITMPTAVKLYVAIQLLAQPLVTLGNIRGSSSSTTTTRTFLQEVDQSNNYNRRQLKNDKVDTCQDVPLRFKTNGDVANFGRVYASVTADNNTSMIDPTLLCDNFIDAYANSTNCSAVVGSYREISKCTPLTATGPTDDSYAFLLEYFSNVQDGILLFSYTDIPAPECTCQCRKGILPGISEVDPTTGQLSCTCFCDPNDVECECAAPFTGDFLTKLNSMEPSYSFVDARQLVLLDIDECNVNQTVFDFTTICPGMDAEGTCGTNYNVFFFWILIHFDYQISAHVRFLSCSRRAVFDFLTTDFPSMVPTESPSGLPTETPT